MLFGLKHHETDFQSSWGRRARRSPGTGEAVPSQPATAGQAATVFTPRAFPTEMTSAVAGWSLGTKRGHETREVLLLSPGESVPSTFPPKPQVLTDTLPEKILEGRGQMPALSSTKEQPLLTASTQTCPPPKITKGLWGGAGDPASQGDGGALAI